jgi:hypothetical protein
MSKFTSAMNAAKDRSSLVAEAVEPQVTSRVAPEAQVAAPAPVRRGRPAGKRSNHESVQVTAYIQAETHYATKLALLMNSRKGAPKKDFSDLVQELLAGWLKVQH